MLAIKSTRLAPRLATTSLQKLQPPHLPTRSFSAFPSLRQPQASTPAQAEHSYQPHPADSPKLPGPTHRNSRPHEDWVTVHPVYKPNEVRAVKVVRAERTSTTDRLASGMVWLARRGFDTITGYKHSSPEEAIAALKKAGKTDLSVEALRKEGYLMSPKQWFLRILFLESIAGVPGFTAGILRHLRSLRRLKRDNGWINTLLQEAENERMHLLTFLKLHQAGPLLRGMIIVAQGVFTNLFFLAYCISPKACHRFVGYLEEEAVVTYSQILDEMKRGHLPEWASEGDVKVPRIAIDYWRLGEDANMEDLILAVRADESNHRFVNHTLASLKPDDVNPFGFKHASPEMAGTLPGLSRQESLSWSENVEKEVREGLKQSEKELKEEKKE